MNELNLKFSQINSKIDLVVLQLLSIGGANIDRRFKSFLETPLKTTGFIIKGSK